MKKIRRAMAALLLICFVLPALFGALNYRAAAEAWDRKQGMLSGMEEALKAAFPFSEQLKSSAVTLRLICGQKQQKGIFIAEDSLIEDTKDPVSEYIRKNIEGIKEFSENCDIPEAYCMLIPAASAIRQADVPVRAPLYNQWMLIDSVTRSLEGTVGTADAYHALFQNNTSYIYYNTDSALTSLGGYYVYAVLAQKLGKTVRERSQFSITTVCDDYYGKLYEKLPYGKVQPDMIQIYSFERYSRNYLVTHYEDGIPTKIYNTLFPKWLAEMDGDRRSVFLGGQSEVVDIYSSSPYSDSLLVIADDTMLSYIPMLANHYKRVTVADVGTVSGEALKQLLKKEDYDQLLFACSTDTFIHTDDYARITDAVIN